jgi:hypothetical protein
MPTMQLMPTSKRLGSFFKFYPYVFFIFYFFLPAKKAPAVDGLMPSFAFLPVKANGPCVLASLCGL